MRTHTHRLTLQSSVVDVFTLKLFMWRIGISSDLCYYKTKLKHKTVDCLSVGPTFRLEFRPYSSCFNMSLPSRFIVIMSRGVHHLLSQLCILHIPPISTKFITPPYFGKMLKCLRIIVQLRFSWLNVFLCFFVSP